MNDPLKYLIAGAAIAIVCGAAGTMGGVWLVKETAGNQKPEIRNQDSGIRIQSPVIRGQGSVFSGQQMQPKPVITIPPRSASGSNIVFRPTQPTGKMPISYSQFQKAQELPEVKAAREAFMEAQKRYSEAMKKAMGGGDGGQNSEDRSQKAEFRRQ
ncbi:MAG: hypothetical protein WCV00_02555 [Verrucomicrobiia bacterium]